MTTALLAPAAPATMPVAPAEKTPADVLRHAALLLLERDWCQDELEDEAGRLCTSGAINLAATGRSRPSAPTALEESARVAAGDAFRQHVGCCSIPEWNDAPGRSTAGVVEALRGAAAEAS